MKTIHKLVLKSYLGPMFLTFFIVMFVLMMNFIWRYIDELVGKGLDCRHHHRADELRHGQHDSHGPAAGDAAGGDHDAGRTWAKTTNCWR